MRKWVAGALCALLMLLLCPLSLADGEGAVVQSSCSVVQSGDYYLVYCYAQIHNNADSIICLEQGEFMLHSGEQLLASQPVEQLWPNMINPGEDGYVFGVIAFEPDENGQPVVPQVTGLEYVIHYMTVEEEFASVDLSVTSEIERDESGGLTVLCTVDNPSHTDAYGAAVAFGLYTDGGAMVYADGMVLRNVGIPAGGTALVRFPVDDALSGQWASYGANVVEARACASFRDGTD